MARKKPLTYHQQVTAGLTTPNAQQYDAALEASKADRKTRVARQKSQAKQ